MILTIFHNKQWQYFISKNNKIFYHNVSFNFHKAHFNIYVCLLFSIHHSEGIFGIPHLLTIIVEFQLIKEVSVKFNTYPLLTPYNLTTIHSPVTEVKCKIQLLLLLNFNIENAFYLFIIQLIFKTSPHQLLWWNLRIIVLYNLKLISK